MIAKNIWGRERNMFTTTISHILPPIFVATHTHTLVVFCGAIYMLGYANTDFIFMPSIVIK